MTETLEQLEKAGPRAIIALLLWKNRHANPNLAVTITQADMDALKQCLEYQEAAPDVAIWRKPGAVLVGLVEKGTELKDKDGQQTSMGNAITPVENNQGDLDRANSAKALTALKEQAPLLARRLRSEDQAGICSSDTVSLCADALIRLANA